MKGNNGKGSRQRLKRKLLILTGGVGVFLLCLSPFISGGVFASFRASFTEYNRVWRVLDESTPVEDPIWKDILQAHHHVSELQFFPELHNPQKEEYSGYYLYFCRLEWNLYKKNPSHYAMFRFLVRNSPNCQTNLVKVPLRLAVQRIREYDEANGSSTAAAVRHLKLSAAIFHESRCGSTLTANMLASMNPPKTRVYSESEPIIRALTQCDEHTPACWKTLGPDILRDVMYLMLRSDDPREERAFIKFPSHTALHIPLFRQAFPQTPWLFVYRDPVQVLMSYFKHDPSLKSISNCGPHHSFPRTLRTSVQHHLQGRAGESNGNAANRDSLSPTEYCAAHLATLTESAVQAMTTTTTDDSSSTLMIPGIPVNYHQLPDILWDDVLPNRIGLSLTEVEKERMQACSQEYSKGWSRDRQYKYQDDAESKNERASEEIRKAAETFLRESYVALEETNSKRSSKKAER